MTVQERLLPAMKFQPEMPLATIGAAMGSNVRVGLEDSLWMGPGKMAESNADQVTRIRHILEALNLGIATPDEARQILRLKGKFTDTVAGA